MIATRWVIGNEARRAFPDNLEFMVYSPVTVGPWTVLDPLRQISNRSNQLSLEQLKLPRGPEVELHGNNLTKDAERNGGYICTALGQAWQVFRLGLENRVLLIIASSVASLQGSRQHLPVPFGPMYFCVIPSFDSEELLPQVSSAHQPISLRVEKSAGKSKNQNQTGIRVAVETLPPPQRRG